MSRDFDTNYFSLKCRWLSMIAAFAVVGQHSVTWLWSAGVEDFVATVQKNVTLHLKFAVPLFLVFSGYWFMKSFSKYGYLKLLSKKFKSLYVPFVIGCAIGEIAVWPTSFFSTTAPSLKSLLFTPFLITDGLSLAFHLWYIRALLLIFLAAPLCWYLTKKEILLLCVFVVSRFFPVVDVGPYCFQCVATVVPYFFLGALLSEGNKLATRFSNRTSLCVTVLSLLLLIIVDVFPEWSIPHCLDSQEVRVFLCVVIAWFGFDVLPIVWKDLGCLKYSFFVYIIHVSVMRYCGNMLRYTFDPSEPGVRLCAYILNWSCFFICIGIAWICDKFTPKVYRIMSGGR